MQVNEDVEDREEREDMIDGEEEQQGDGGKKVAEEVSECCQDHCGPPWTTVDHRGVAGKEHMTEIY